MHESTESVDHYETLQISPHADAEMVHAAYRMLARRYHPDNRDTGDAARFRLITEAHQLLGDLARRTTYDANRRVPHRDARAAVPAATPVGHDVQLEQACRLAVLDVLYARRRVAPGKASVFQLDLVEHTIQARAHLEFTVWYLVAKGLIERSDNSGLAITVAGVEYVEENHLAAMRRSLPEAALRVA
jgi:curved DNA-binding protein CbpA